MKNKTLVKFLSAILAVVMVLCSAPLSGFVGLKFPDVKLPYWNLFDFAVDAEAATYSGTCGTNVNWSLDTETGVLDITGTGAMRNYSYSSVPWYSYRSYVKSVNIQNGVTSIGSYAFYNCYRLTTVTIGDSVESIGSYAFSDCDSLTSVTIGDSVTSIGSSAFYDCDSLTSVTIPDSVTSIGSSAFYDCDSLTSVTIGDGVTSIGEGVFSHCYSLTSVTIPDSVTSIGSGAFWYCYSLTSVKVDSNNKNYSSDSYGVLYNKNKTTLIQYPIGNSRKTFTIPDSVESIGNYAFHNCDSLTSVTIGNGVKSIDYQAFFDCDSLTSVTIPDSVESIGSYAFYSCDSLTSVTIGDSVESIGSWAFEYCDSLTSVTIPDSVESIGYAAFSYCDSLTSVTIPDSVTSIGSSAFYDCDSLTSVTIGDSVESIGDYAFYNCNSLTDVYYTGTEAQWKKISIDSFNSPLTNATIHYNSSMPEGKLNYSQKHTVSDYASNDAKYENEYFGGEAIALDGTDGTADLCIPGLSKSDNLVPQGIAYYEAKNWMLVSAYSKKSPADPSVIFALDMDTGKLVGEYKIINKGGSTHTGHVGGIATSKYNLYITLDGANIGYVPLSELTATSKDIKVVDKKSMSSWLGEADVSYLSIDNGMLITGNFYDGKDYKTPAKNSNSAILAQNLSGDSSENEWSNFKSYASFATINVPDSVMKIQGVAYRDNKIYISSSYGRKNESKLYIADVNRSDGYKLENIVGYKAPPMMEDLEFIDGYLYTVFESASAFYQLGLDGKGKSKNPTDVAWRIDYKSLIGESREETTSTGDVENKTVQFVQGDDVGEVDVSFRQSWFKSDSLNYNHNLARLASQYAMLGYDDSTSLTDKPYLRLALKAIGMDNIEIIGRASRDQVNYFIASRKITVDSKQYNLIFVGLIGSYQAQWYSNFDPGRGATHQGFNSAKEFVKTALTNYIASKGFSKDNTKILITGHSRGAAASNLLAADLIKSEAYAKKENIYTYAFATPNSNTLAERTDAKFNRIYNIVNPEDFVTKCLPAAWGYGRYGQTIVLPSKTNDKTNYKTYLKNMKPYFERFTDGKKYHPFAKGEQATYDILISLTSTVKNINDLYVDRFNWLGEKTSVQNFFQKTLCQYVGEKEGSAKQKAAKDLMVDTFLSRSDSSDIILDITDYFVGNEGLDSIPVIGLASATYFTNSHQAETYCAYMMSMSEAQLRQDRKSTVSTVNCPVDVTVIDNETGEVVGKIVNNIIDEEIAAKDNAIVMDVDGDSKSFWLPSDGSYEVILTGNDNGTMDYTVSEVDSDAGETERVNFYGVEITDGDSYTGEMISGEFIADEYTITSENGEVISPDEKLDDSSMQSVEINVTVSGNGYATDSMTVTKGDYVSLSATPEDGYKFDGWYENGKLVSKEKSYSFVAKESRNLKAAFSAGNEEPVVLYEYFSTNYNTATYVRIDRYIDIPDGMGYTIETESDAYGIAHITPVDKGFNIFAAGRGSTFVTATVTLDNGEVYIFEYDVDVTYTWWQWLIIIFLFGWIWY